MSYASDFCLTQNSDGYTFRLESSVYAWCWECTWSEIHLLDLHASESSHNHVCVWVCLYRLLEVVTKWCLAVKWKGHAVGLTVMLVDCLFQF